MTQMRSSVKSKETDVKRGQRTWLRNTDWQHHQRCWVFSFYPPGSLSTLPHLLPSWEVNPSRPYQQTPSLPGSGSGRSGKRSDQRGRRVRLGLSFLLSLLQVCFEVPVSLHWRHSSSQGDLQCPQVLISACEPCFLISSYSTCNFHFLPKVSLDHVYLPSFRFHFSIFTHTSNSSNITFTSISSAAFPTWKHSPVCPPTVNFLGTGYTSASWGLELCPSPSWWLAQPGDTAWMYRSEWVFDSLYQSLTQSRLTTYVY